MAAPDEPRGTSTGWAIAKTMLVGALVAFGVSVWLAFTPIQNPGVQDCGTALGYIVFNRPDLRATPGEAPGSTELALQATCRERVVPQLGRAALALGAALFLGIVGATIGLIDDRIAYRRAPRFETLLRERPTAAPGRYLRAPPVVAAAEVGRTLPPVEGRDVALLVGTGLLVTVGVVVTAGPAAVLETVGSLQWLLVLLAAVVQVLALSAAAGQELLAGGGPLRAAGSTAVQSSAAVRLLPGLGPLGYDSFALVWRGGRRAAVLEALRRRQALGIAGWTVLAVSFGLAQMDAPRPDLEPSPAFWVLVGAAVLFVLVGLGRAGDRWRRLLVRPVGPAGVLRADDGFSPTRVVRLCGQTAAAIALPLAGVAALALAVAAAGGRVGFAAVAVVALGGMAVGALVPTPGGVGGVEVAVIVGLVLSGVPLEAAVVAVVLWRVVTLWLPVAVGAAPFRRATEASVRRPVLA